MTLGFYKVHSYYKEPVGQKEVILYQKDFEMIKNGTPPHSEAHKEIDTHLHVVKQALENPDCVKSDSDYSDRKIYYAWYSGGREYPGHHMKVVVTETWYGKLSVVTAYFTDGFKNGEKVIWTKNNT